MNHRQFSLFATDSLVNSTFSYFSLFLSLWKDYEMPVDVRMVLGKSKLTWSRYLQGTSRAEECCIHSENSKRLNEKNVRFPSVKYPLLLSGGFCSSNEVFKYRYILGLCAGLLEAKVWIRSSGSTELLFSSGMSGFLSTKQSFITIKKLNLGIILWHLNLHPNLLLKYPMIIASWILLFVTMRCYN